MNQTGNSAGRLTMMPEARRPAELTVTVRWIGEHRRIPNACRTSPGEQAILDRQQGQPEQFLCTGLPAKRSLIQEI